MDEAAVIALLGHLTKQVLAEADAQWTSDAREMLAERIADGSWNGLLLLMREGLARDGTLLLHEFGRFRRTESGISFHPAESLLSAASLNLPADEGAGWLAKRALFYLNEATKILATFSSDLVVEGEGAREPAKKETREEKLLRVIFGFGEPGHQQPLSDTIDSHARVLRGIARRLRGEMPLAQGRTAQRRTKLAEVVAEGGEIRDFAEGGGTRDLLDIAASVMLEKGRRESAPEATVEKLTVDEFEER